VWGEAPSRKRIVVQETFLRKESTMRIIAGKYKKHTLYSVPGITTRPTTDFLREVIFSVVQNFSGQRVLDLYAGTGALAFEALSRGANFADLVEMAIPALTTIARNMEYLRCSEFVHIHRQKVSVFLAKTDLKFDTIFIDPPYNKNLINPTLELIFSRQIILPDGYIVIEHSPAEPIEDEYNQYLIYTKKMKLSMVSILKVSDTLEEKESHDEDQ
jgi:16S rRNA (guanine966-N2)-methyltransferase